MNFWLIAEKWEVPGLTQKLMDWTMETNNSGNK
jgi:hypothetical protein